MMKMNFLKLMALFLFQVQVNIMLLNRKRKSLCMIFQVINRFLRIISTKKLMLYIFSNIILLSNMVKRHQFIMFEMIFRKL